MRGTRRHALNTAAVATLFTVAGLTVSIPPASGDIGAELSYTCNTPSGIKKIGLQVAGSIPASGSVGRPVEFGRIEVTAEVDSADLSAFVASGSPAGGEEPGTTSPLGVTGTARLSVSAVQGGVATDAQWSPFSIQSEGNPQADTLKIAGTQVVPPLIASVPGKIRLLSTALELRLTPLTGQSSIDPIACAPDGTAELAGIDIDGRGTAAGSPQAGRRGGESATGQTNAPLAQNETNCRELVVPEGYFNPDPLLGLDDVGKTPPNLPPFVPGFGANAPFCVNLTGLANSNKLAGAIPVDAESLVRRGVRSAQIGSPVALYTQQRGAALAIPRESRATLLGFGFMPTSVTVQAQQVAGQNGDQLGNFRNDLYNQRSNFPGFSLNDKADRAWVRAHVSALASDASINGMSLDLGPNCRSVRNVVQFESFLGNVSLGQVPLTAGSHFTGRFTIPPFRNCGVGEDLNPLLTATASGNSNFVSLEASRWCQPVTGQDCAVGDPRRPIAPATISIRHGGELTASLSPFAINITGVQPARQIRCDSALAKFQLKKGRWLSRNHVGQLTAIETSGCVITPEGVSVQVEKASDTPTFVNLIAPVDPKEGTANFNLDGLRLRVTQPESRCNFLLGVWLPGNLGLPNTPLAMSLRLRYNNFTHNLTGARAISAPIGGIPAVLENNCGAPLNFPATQQSRVTFDWPASELVSKEPRLSITSP